MFKFDHTPIYILVAENYTRDATPEEVIEHSKKQKQLSRFGGKTRTRKTRNTKNQRNRRNRRNTRNTRNTRNLFANYKPCHPRD